jgi:hypothetical protein
VHLLVERTLTNLPQSKLPPKSGLLLAAITTPDNRPSILADEWNAESMKNRGESITDVFIEHIARYGKRFQEICDKTKAGTYSKDEFTYPIFYMPNACLSEMATYLLEAEKRDPSSSESLHAAVLASYEATFERKEGRTLPREGYAMFETLYQDFKTRTAAEKSPQ